MPSASSKPANTSPRALGTLAAVAAAGAATAIWVGQRARKAERDNPPRGQFVDVDGVRLHYIDEGSGPPVLLLHGNMVLVEDFIASGLVRALARDHRVIAFDRPGFGYSARPRDRVWTPRAQAALLGQALDQLGLGQGDAAPVVLGHSWGALVAIAMGMEGLASVKGLVLVSGYYYPTARLDVALTAPVALPVVGDVMRYTLSAAAARLLLKPTVKAMFAPASVPADFFEILPREMLLRPFQLRAEAEDATLMIPAVAKMRHQYAELSMPVSIVTGAEDKIIDVDAHSVRLHRELPQSTLTVIPGAGHMAHYTGLHDIVDAVDGMRGAEPAVTRSR